MLSDLFINACILIATIFITIEILQNDYIKSFSPAKKSIISGILFSISSILLMKYHIRVTDVAFFDFRNISQAASAFYGGPVSSLVTGLSSSLFRIFHFGLNKNSVLTFINMTISALLCAYIAKRTWDKRLKWALMIISTKFMHILLFIFVLHKTSDIIKVTFSLWLGTLFVATAAYYVLEHLCIAHTQIERLKKQASVDFLTGVHNTRNFNFLYNQSLRSFKETNQVFSVLMVDIDFFKKTNDTYGHLAGDIVLKDLGNILKSFSTEDAIVGRVGGEEFCILLGGYSKKDALSFAENLRSYIANNTFTLNSKHKINITVSIGLATYRETVFDVRNVREIADQRLYECKKTGRNKVCF